MIFIESCYIVSKYFSIKGAVILAKRSKKQIENDRKNLKNLIQNMNSVEQIMEWKKHPYKTDNEVFTVEAYNCEKTKKLNWEKTDVLYSFLGIYVIGLIAYYPDEFNRDGVVIKDLKNRNIYNLKIINEIVSKKQKLCKEKKLEKKEVLDINPQLNKFIEVYFSIGNVIPVWPGANVDRGCSYMYDIPELYYTKNEVWFRILKEIYKNAYLDDVLSPNLVFENNNEINYNPSFWNFSSTEEFLDAIVNDKYSREIRIGLYSKWLNRIVGVINKRNKLIEKQLKKCN